MTSSDNAFSALDAIDTVAFKVGLKGYNVDEVDEFLERLSIETRQLKDQLQQQRQQLRQAAERINQLEGGRPPAAPLAPAAAPAPMAAPGRPAAPVGDQVTSMISMAQEFIEHAQRDAAAKAQELMATAQERAREIVSEARGKAEDEVNRLNGLKQRLSEDVEGLSRHLAGERSRLGSALNELANWIETQLQTGSAIKSGSTAAPEASSSAPGSMGTPQEEAPRVQVVPPPAPAPSAPPASPPPPSPTTIGDVLNLDGSNFDDRS